MSTPELRDTLAQLSTESADAALADLDNRSTDDMVEEMNRHHASVAAAVNAAAPAVARAVDLITERMRLGGRLLYIGAGTPGRLGVLDASECPPTFGVDPSLVSGVIAGGDRAIQQAVEGAEDDHAAGATDLQARTLGPTDSVVGVSASGRTPYVIGALEYARSIGALAVSVANNPDSPMAQAADVAIETVTGPELVAGSTRLKAGTAQKMVLNSLSTLVMIKLNRVYGNVMVDLQVTNAKLLARAERTVMTLTGADADTATRTLELADSSVKIATVMIMKDLDPAQARALLDAQDGNLRSALET